MASSYPGGLDNFSTSHQDNVDEIIHAATINDNADAINKIEAELGTNPKGSSADVKTRLGLIQPLTGATAATRYVGATTSGAPVSGSFLKGDFIITQDGHIYICTVAGSPGTWTQVAGSAATSPLTTKGDVWGFSTVDARIPVGADGQVLTADATQALGVKWAGTGIGLNVKNYGAKGDVTTVGTGGTDDTAAFNAALAALPTVNGNPAGLIYIPAGVYRINGAVNNLGPYVSMVGDGINSSIIDYRGSGDALRAYDANYPGVGTSFFAGRLANFCIDGTGSVAGATGLHAGDLSELELYLLVQNFSGAGSTGYLFDNSVSWTERLNGRIIAQNNTNSVVFTVSGTGQSSNSFFYSELTVDLLHTTTGVIFQNGASMLHSHLRIIGNMLYAASGTNAALTMAGQVPGVNFRAAQTATQTNAAGGTLTVTKPLGTSSGDVLVAVVMVSNASNVPATPTGWTLLDSGSAGPSVATYYKIAGSSEPSSYSWTVANLASVVLSAYTGCDQVNPINVHGALNRTTATPLTATSVTTTAPSKIVFVSGIGGTPTITTPTNFTSRGTAVGAASDSAFMADMDQSALGATGSITAAINATNNAYSGLIALKPTGAHQNPNAYANLTGCRLDIMVEVRPNGQAVQPQTIYFPSSGNFIEGCIGVLSFQSGSDSTGTGSFATSNSGANVLSFLGFIKGDTSIESHNSWTAAAIGGFNNP